MTLSEAPGRAFSALAGTPDPVQVVTGARIEDEGDGSPTIVEFTDLQCPFCSRFSTTTFEEIRKTYIDTGQVRFVTRDLPLPFHQHAMRAAKASRCAGEQSKFWEMRTALVRNAATLSPELMTATAQTLKLDMAAFEACVESARFDALIQKDMADARSIQVTGTPSFVIGRTTDGGLAGVRLVGAQPLAAFDARIKALLSAQTRTQ
jgi:protein-disulfide isomerase